MKRKILITLAPILVVIMIFVVVQTANLLKEEDRPFDIVKGVFKLMISSDEVVEISESPNERLLVRDIEVLKGELVRDGWEYCDQIGSHYIYEKNTVKKNLNTKQISSKFLLVSVNHATVPDLEATKETERDDESHFALIYGKEVKAITISQTGGNDSVLTNTDDNEVMAEFASLYTQNTPYRDDVGTTHPYFVQIHLDENSEKEIICLWYGTQGFITIEYRGKQFNIQNPKLEKYLSALF